MLNYYFTGLEYGKGKGQILQTVGTPYLGSGLAGNLAWLGEIFGIACGTTFDMTYDGAKLWLTGITMENRKYVEFYTTMGDWNACSWAANMVLTIPNDGTTEIQYANLAGGVNKGTTKGWCHTEGLNYDPQCYDRSRNQLMNSRSAF